MKKQSIGFLLIGIIVGIAIMAIYPMVTKTSLIALSGPDGYSHQSTVSSPFSIQNEIMSLLTVSDSALAISQGAHTDVSLLYLGSSIWDNFYNRQSNIADLGMWMFMGNSNSTDNGGTSGYHLMYIDVYVGRTGNTAGLQIWWLSPFEWYIVSYNGTQLYNPSSFSRTLPLFVSMDIDTQTLIASNIHVSQ